MNGHGFGDRSVAHIRVGGQILLLGPAGSPGMAGLLKAVRPATSSQVRARLHGPTVMRPLRAWFSRRQPLVARGALSDAGLVDATMKAIEHRRLTAVLIPDVGRFASAPRLIGSPPPERPPNPRNARPGSPSAVAGPARLKGPAPISRSPIQPPARVAVAHPVLPDVATMSDWVKFGFVLDFAWREAGGDLRIALKRLYDERAKLAYDLFKGLVVLAALHLVGLGEAIDLAMAAAAYAYAGIGGVEAVLELYQCAKLMHGARSMSELQKAGKHFELATEDLGIAALSLLMARVARRASEAAGAEEGAAAKGALKDGRAAKSPATTSQADRPGLFALKKMGLTEPGSQPLTPELEALMESAQQREGLSSAGYPDLPKDAAKAFDGIPKPWSGDEEAGRLYRVIGQPESANGSWWTRTPPPGSEAEWRAASAVANNWNGDGAYVTSEANGLTGWIGNAAPQMSSDKINVLRGGGEQIWIPAGTANPTAPLRTPWNQGR